MSKGRRGGKKGGHAGILPGGETAYDSRRLVLYFRRGPDNRLLGRVGVANAAPPGSAAAWLAVMPNGQVIYFDEDGDREDRGVWQGCEGPQKRTCTYVTHVIWAQRYLNRNRGGVSVGVGVGVGY